MVLASSTLRIVAAIIQRDQKNRNELMTKVRMDDHRKHMEKLEDHRKRIEKAAKEKSKIIKISTIHVEMTTLIIKVILPFSHSAKPQSKYTQAPTTSPSRAVTESGVLRTRAVEKSHKDVVTSFNFTTVYMNPSSILSTSKDIALTSLNRCHMFPRCHLFGCCGHDLVIAAHGYFKFSEKEGHFPFSCMFDDWDSCSYQDNITARIDGLPIMSITITNEVVEQMLVELPPTPPAAMHRLGQRKQFKVLYLVQGDYKSNLEPCIKQLEDYLYLSYKEPQQGKFKIALSIPTKLCMFKNCWVAVDFKHVDFLIVSI